VKRGPKACEGGGELLGRVFGVRGTREGEALLERHELRGEVVERHLLRSQQVPTRGGAKKGGEELSSGGHGREVRKGEAAGGVGVAGDLAAVEEVDPEPSARGRDVGGGGP
jgi:hypothetical protein